MVIEMLLAMVECVLLWKVGDLFWMGPLTKKWLYCYLGNELKKTTLLSRGWDQNADKRPLIVEFIELAKQLENQVNHSVRRIPPPKPKKPIMAVSPTEAKMPTVLSKELEKCCDSALETSTTTMDDDKTIVNLSDVVESHTIVRNLPPVNIHLPSVSQIEVFVESVVFAKEETNHTV